ncbi:MAG: hypothetical protein FJX57_11695, partial [Alphaproteobacteria bacterium]|nr:hypothetical protein [Alphaproteobacteria bacterium]
MTPRRILLALTALLVGAPALLPAQEPALTANVPATDEAPPIAGGRLIARTLPATTSAADRERMRRAFAAVDAGRWEEAHGAASAHAIGSKIIRWLDIQRPGGGYGFDAIAQFLADNPAWPLPDAVTRRAEEQIAAVTDDQRVRDWYKDRRPMTSFGAIRLAEALDRGGNKVAAAALAREIWLTMPLSERQEQELPQRFTGAIGARERWQRLDRLVWERRFGEAQRLLPHVDAGRRALAEAR